MHRSWRRLRRHRGQLKQTHGRDHNGSAATNKLVFSYLHRPTPRLFAG